MLSSVLIACIPLAIAVIWASTTSSRTTGILLLGSLVALTLLILLYRIHTVYDRPLEDLTTAMREASKNQDLEIRLTGNTSPEMAELAQAFNQLLDRIAHQESALKGYNEELCTLVDQQTSKLRNQNEYVNGILEFMIEGLLVTDTSGHISTTNLSALALTGHDHKDLEGRLLDTLFLETKDSNTPGIIKATQDEGLIMNRERCLIGREGERIPVIVSASLMRNHKGKATGIVCLLLDITERKQFEDELSDARDEAIAADKLKSEFLATMSHEIRTPMNGVVGLTSLLLETPLNEEQREFSEAINSCGQSLLRIINDILDFSKIEAGRMQLDPVDFNVSRLVEDVTELFWAKAHEKGFEVVSQNAATLPRWAKADANRIRQILSNLVSNAVKFTEAGGITVSASLQEETEDQYLLRFLVKDTGIGISAEGREKLFQSFSQVDGSYSRSYGGTGLGLAISKQLVTLMDGVIGVDSVEGEGSEFWFVVPVEKPEANLRELQLPASHFNGRIALIAASDGTLREALRTQSWGVSVHEATTSLETLVLLKDAEARKRDYDIILVDVGVEHDGETLVELLLKNPQSHTSALGVVTQLGNNVDYLSQKESIHAILTKPVREQQLFDCFSRL